MAKTLLDILVSYNESLANPIIDESLIKQSALATVLPFIPTNKGRKHEYRKYITEPTPSHGDINSGASYGEAQWVVETTAVDELEIIQAYTRKYVAENGANIFDEDAPNFVNPLIKTALEGLYRGKDASSLISFKGLKQIAAEDSTVTTVSGASPNNNTNALFILRIDDKLTGLYNPTALGVTGGNDITGIIGNTFMGPNGGEYTKTVDGKTTLMKGILHTMQYAILAKTTNRVAMINGIDATHKPTIANIVEAMKNVKARLGGRIVVIGNLATLGYVDELKADKIRSGVKEEEYKTYITMFDNAQVLPDEILGANY